MIRNARQFLLTFGLTLVVLLAASHTLAATSPPPEDILTVTQGQSLLVEYDDVTRVAVGNGDLVDVRVFKDKSEILLIALQPGVTDLRLWSSQGEPSRYLLEVHGPDHGGSITSDELAELFDGIAGVEVVARGGNTIVKGRAESEADYDYINQAISRYPNVVSHLRAPAFDREPTIMLQARLLEVRTTALKDLGVQWSQFAQGPVFGYLRDFTTNGLYRLTNAPDGGELPFRVGGGGQSFAGLSTSLDSTINLLLENGDARILAEPTMTCISGGSADFLAGGEVPIPVRDEFGSPSVEFKEFGIILKFAPLVDTDRFIRTDVQVEVSAVDPSIAVLDIPGFLTRKTKTRMNTQDGQTMVIAGLVSQEDAKNVSKVPVLGQIPVLGELFKSRQFRNQKSELVVLVTPRIIDGAGPENQGYQERFDELNSKAEKSMRYSVWD